MKALVCADGCVAEGARHASAVSSARRAAGLGESSESRSVRWAMGLGLSVMSCERRFREPDSVDLPTGNWYSENRYMNLYGLELKIDPNIPDIEISDVYDMD